MPSKKKVVYTSVPKPVKPAVKGKKSAMGHRVNCKECGTNMFSLTAMLEHEFSCDLAKKKNLEAAKEKKKQANRSLKRY